MHVLTGQNVYYLVPGATYTIGRKIGCDITVTEEVNYGISRVHGRLDCHVNGEVLYTDLSQFGSFIGSKTANSKVHSKQTVPLRKGASLRLAHAPLLWKLEELTVTTSGLAGADKAEVVRLCGSVGISYSSSWSDNCTTVVMTTINSTEKVIAAVAKQRSIIKLSFLRELVRAVSDHVKITSDEKSRLPAINDMSLRMIDFRPIVARKTLFDGLRFVFFTEQEKKRSCDVVESCGGCCQVLDLLDPNRRSVIASEVSIVMETKDTAASSYVSTVLADRGLRPTKHTDIILAMMQVSRNRLFKGIRDATQTQALHVQDTQVLTYPDHLPPDNARIVMPTCQAVPSVKFDPSLSKTPSSEVKSDEVKSNDISALEPSVLPDGLDVSGVMSVALPNRSPPVVPQDTAITEPTALPPSVESPATPFKCGVSHDHRFKKPAGRVTPATAATPLSMRHTSFNSNTSLFASPAPPSSARRDEASSSRPLSKSNVPKEPFFTPVVAKRGHCEDEEQHDPGRGDFGTKKRKKSLFFLRKGTHNGTLEVKCPNQESIVSSSPHYSADAETVPIKPEDDKIKKKEEEKKKIKKDEGEANVMLSPSPPPSLVCDENRRDISNIMPSSKRALPDTYESGSKKPRIQVPPTALPTSHVHTKLLSSKWLTKPKLEYVKAEPQEGDESVKAEPQEGDEYVKAEPQEGDDPTESFRNLVITEFSKSLIVKREGDTKAAPPQNHTKANFKRFKKKAGIVHRSITITLSISGFNSENVGHHHEIEVPDEDPLSPESVNGSSPFQKRFKN